MDRNMTEELKELALAGRLNGDQMFVLFQACLRTREEFWDETRTNLAVALIKWGYAKTEVEAREELERMRKLEIENYDNNPN